jgi:hypothetical protein
MIRRLAAFVVYILWLLAGLASPALSADWSNTIAVIIANPDHESDAVPSLPYANADYDMMLEYVRDGLGVPARNIRAVKNADQNEFKRIFGKGRWLDQRMERADGNANVLVYISAHGVPDDSKNAYFVPSNGQPSFPDELYSRDNVVAALERIKARQGGRAAQVLAIFDSCFSGSSYNGDVSPGKTGLPVLEIEPQKPITILSATQGKGIAYPDKETGLSALTSTFLLGAAGQADSTSVGGDGDGATSITEIANFAKRTVPYRSGHGQTPQIAVSENFAIPQYAVSKISVIVQADQARERWESLKSDLKFSPMIGLETNELRRRIPQLRELNARIRRMRQRCQANPSSCSDFSSELQQASGRVLKQRMRLDDELAWQAAQDKQTFALNCQAYRDACNRLMARDSTYQCAYAEDLAYDCPSIDEQLLLDARSNDSVAAWQEYADRCEDCDHVSEVRQALTAIGSKQRSVLEGYLKACKQCPLKGDANELLLSLQQAEAADQSLWDEARADNRSEAFRAYIANCGTCRYRSDAQARLEVAVEKEKKAAELAAFNSASKSEDIQALQLYIDTCIYCERKVQATAKLKSLTAESARTAYEKGEKYYYGQGVTKSYAEAVKWYRKAAEQGYEASILALEKLD